MKHEEKTFTEEEAREFYAHAAEEEYFEGLIELMTQGPCHVLVLSKAGTGVNTVADWREFIGPASVEEAKEEDPDSLRAQFGKEGFMNAIHGSDSSEAASKYDVILFMSGFPPT